MDSCAELIAVSLDGVNARRISSGYLCKRDSIERSEPSWTGKQPACCSDSLKEAFNRAPENKPAGYRLALHRSRSAPDGPLRELGGAVVRPGQSIFLTFSRLPFHSPRNHPQSLRSTLPRRPPS